MANAHAIVVVGPPEGATAVIENAQRKGVAIFHARLVPDAAMIADIGRRAVLAFAGIGNPDKFFATLIDAGVAVAEQTSFPDHHIFTAADARALLRSAEADNLLLVTTEKDLARLGGRRRLATLAARANALPIRLVIEEASAFRALIHQTVTQPIASPSLVP
jgi:tetraacyldisaccharide 4'-kinase